MRVFLCGLIGFHKVFGGLNNWVVQSEMSNLWLPYSTAWPALNPKTLTLNRTPWSFLAPCSEVTVDSALGSIGSRLRTWGLGFRVWGSGFRV